MSRPASKTPAVPRGDETAGALAQGRSPFTALTVPTARGAERPFRFSVRPGRYTLTRDKAPSPPVTTMRRRALFCLRPPSLVRSARVRPERAQRAVPRLPPAGEGRDRDGTARGDPRGTPAGRTANDSAVTTCSRAASTTVSSGVSLLRHSGRRQKYSPRTAIPAPASVAGIDRAPAAQRGGTAGVCGEGFLLVGPGASSG